MDEKREKQLLKMAIESAKRINQAYSNHDSTSITYNVAELDTILRIMSLLLEKKYFISNTDENYEKIKSIEIKAYNEEAHNYITTAIIEI